MYFANGNGKHLEGRTSLVDTEDSDLDERSFNRSQPLDFVESLGSPISSSCFNMHPMFGEAWNALKRSLVYFRGQAVGTVAARDHSSEELNYNQVKFIEFFCLQPHKIVITCYLSCLRLHVQ